MTKSSGTILAGAGRPAGRGAGTRRRNRTIMAALAVSLLTTSLAMADPPGDGGHDRGHHEWRHDGDHRDWHHDDHDRREHRDERWRDRDERWRDRDEHRYRDRFDSGYYERPHGYYEREWRRGDRLPIAFRAPVYVIPDIALYHLRPPPPGYYWVRVDNNAVLAAIGTGLVVDVAINLFH
jgi:Ni/Co efflux regulator RcnB